MWNRVVAALVMSGGVYASTPALAAPPAAAAAERVDARPAFDERIDAAKAAMMANPNQALSNARAAVALLGSTDTPANALAAAKGRWLEGEALTRLNRPAEAGPVIEAALKTVERLQPGSKLHGDLLMAGGSIQATTGQVQNALESFHKAHDTFRALGEARSQAIALQNIGSVYREAGDFERVLKYYDQSAAVFSNDPALIVSAYNNRGNAHKELGRLDLAEAEYRQALTAARQMGSALLEVRILTNIASAQYLRGELAKADQTADLGLRLAAAGPAAGWRPYLWGVKAQTALKRGDLRQAERLIALTFRGQDLAATTMPYRDFHKTAKQIHARLGDSALALAHMEAFKRLDDEAREVTASANAALMGARFDFKNQKLQIAELKAGQLQRDVQLARANQRLLLGLLVGTTAAFLLGLFAYLSIRRSRNELSRTNEQLQRALEARSRLLATTSHEIRTPLNAILGMTDVLLHEPEFPRQVRGKLEVIHSAGVTMKALVDDILDVARIETGRISIEKTEVELKSLFEEGARLWGGEAEAKDLCLIADLDACPDRAVTDAKRLRQILFNLMSNAVKFTDAGMVTLAVSVRERDGEERLSVRVSDTGPGIPAEHLDRVFEAFHQVDGGTRRKHGGTGLGLAICRDLARALGGDVRAESQVGAGSVFVVDLPLERAEAAAPVTEAAADARPRARALSDSHLMVVTGNPLTRSMVRALLKERVRGLEATNGAEAAEAALRARPVDLLLVDETALDSGSLDDLARAAPGVPIVLLHDDAEPPVHADGARRIARSQLVAALADVLQAAVEAPAPGAEGGHIVTAA